MIANKGLKELDLVEIPIFDGDISTKMVFRLKKFYVNLYTENPLLRKNLNLFLKTQSETLESVAVIRWMGLEVMKTILLMLRLKHVELNEVTHPAFSEFTVENLPQNFSVICLLFDNYSSYKFTGSVLKLFPKIETLKLNFIADQNVNIYCGKL